MSWTKIKAHIAFALAIILAPIGFLAAFISSAYGGLLLSSFILSQRAKIKEGDVYGR